MVTIPVTFSDFIHKLKRQKALLSSFHLNGLPLGFSPRHKHECLVYQPNRGKEIRVLAFQALALRQSESSIIVGCMCLYSEQWSYAIGGSMVTRKQE